MPLCEVCNKREAIGVACVPGVPYSAAYCAECAKAGAEPLDILIANTAACGGLLHTAQWWKDTVQDTLNYLGKDITWFEERVEECQKQLSTCNIPNSSTHEEENLL